MKIDCKFCNTLDCYHEFEQYDDNCFDVDFYFKINDDSHYIFEWSNNELTLLSLNLIKLGEIGIHEKIYFDKKFYFDDFPSESQIIGIIENLVFA